MQGGFMALKRDTGGKGYRREKGAWGRFKKKKIVGRRGVLKKSASRRSGQGGEIPTGESLEEKNEDRKLERKSTPGETDLEGKKQGGNLNDSDEKNQL